jgi:hypothetical protein
VAGPPAAQPEELADLRAEQRPDRGDQLSAGPGTPLGRDPGDRLPGLGVGEGDPLQNPSRTASTAPSGIKTIFNPNGPWCVPYSKRMLVQG